MNRWFFIAALTALGLSACTQTGAFISNLNPASPSNPGGLSAVATGSAVCSATAAAQAWYKSQPSYSATGVAQKFLTATLTECTATNGAQGPGTYITSSTIINGIVQNLVSYGLGTL